MWYNWFSLYLFFCLFGHFFWLSLTVPHLCSWIGINPAKFPLAVVDANNVFCCVSLLIHDTASFNPQVYLLAIMCWRMTKSRVERKLAHLCLTAGSITHMLVLGNGFLTRAYKSPFGRSHAFKRHFIPVPHHCNHKKGISKLHCCKVKHAISCLVHNDQGKELLHSSLQLPKLWNSQSPLSLFPF